MGTTDIVDTFFSEFHRNDMIDMRFCLLFIYLYLLCTSPLPLSIIFETNQSPNSHY